MTAETTIPDHNADEFSQAVAQLNAILSGSTEGPWQYALSTSDTHEEAVAYFREAISRHESGVLHLVVKARADDVPLLIACTGNGPAAEANAKLFMLAREFGPKFVEMCQALLESDQVQRSMGIGLNLIAAERMRQIREEGWTSEHDDQHVGDELSIAAACYAVEGIDIHVVDGEFGEDAWPWDEKWDKREKHDRVRRLAIAGALIAAELDRELRRQARIAALQDPDTGKINFYDAVRADATMSQADKDYWLSMEPKPQEPTP